MTIYHLVHVDRAECRKNDKQEFERLALENNYVPCADDEMFSTSLAEIAEEFNRYKANLNKASKWHYNVTGYFFESVLLQSSDVTEEDLEENDGDLRATFYCAPYIEDVDVAVSEPYVEE